MGNASLPDIRGAILESPLMELVSKSRPRSMYLPRNASDNLVLACNCIQYVFETLYLLNTNEKGGVEPLHSLSCSKTDVTYLVPLEVRGS